MAVPNPEDKMTRMPAADAIKLAKAGEALIIDVRGTDTFKIKHLKGAIDYSLEKLEKGDFSGLPTNRMIIAYCA